MFRLELIKVHSGYGCGIFSKTKRHRIGNGFGLSQHQAGNKTETDRWYVKGTETGDSKVIKRLVLRFIKPKTSCAVIFIRFSKER